MIEEIEGSELHAVIILGKNEWRYMYRPTLQQLQIPRGHDEEVKIISEAAYQWENLVFVMGLHREVQARDKWC